MTNHTSAAGRASESLRRPDHCNRRNTSSAEKKITPPSFLALMMQLGLSGKESFRSCMKISADMMVMMVNWLWWKGSLRSFMKTSTEQKVWLPFSPRRRLVLFIFSRQLRPPHTSQIKLLSSKSCPRIMPSYIWNILANSLKSIIDSVKIEPGTILFSFPSLVNKCPEKENSVSTLSFG